MTNRLETSWKLDGFVDEQRYYCSETPIDPENLPPPKAVLPGDVRTYVDTDIEVGKTYYVAIGSVKNSIEKLSEVKAVLASNDSYAANVVALLRFENGITDETGRIWTMVGNPVVGVDGLSLNGSSGLTTNAEGFDFGVEDFTLEAFITQTTPNDQWREIFMANAGYGINMMLYDKKLAIGRESVANDYTSSVLIQPSLRTHIAVSKVAGVVKGFIAGSKVFEGAYNHSFTSSALHSLGAKANGISGLVGTIHQFRATKGVGRYTSNFVPQNF